MVEWFTYLFMEVAKVGEAMVDAPGLAWLDAGDHLHLEQLFLFFNFTYYLEPDEIVGELVNDLLHVLMQTQVH